MLGWLNRAICFIAAMKGGIVYTCFSKYVTFHIAIKTVYGVNVTTENIGAS